MVSYVNCAIELFIANDRLKVTWDTIRSPSTKERPVQTSQFEGGSLGLA